MSIESAELINEIDLFGPNPPPPSIVRGTIGWNDADEYFDLGTEKDDGRHLFRVTIFAGRDGGTPITPGIADGRQIVCQMGLWPLSAIPPKGMQCLVAFPDRNRTGSGAGVIIALINTGPFSQFGQSRWKMDLGPDTDLVIKARSITLTDHNNRFLSIGPENGVVLQDADGSGLTVNSGAFLCWVASGGDAKSLLQLTSTGASLVQKDSGMLKLDSGHVTLLSNGSLALPAGNVSIGAGATAATPVIFGPTPPGAPSTSVFVSP